MLDFECDLKGATPETLARALLRPLRPRRSPDARSASTPTSDSLGRHAIREFTYDTAQRTAE